MYSRKSKPLKPNKVARYNLIEKNNVMTIL